MSTLYIKRNQSRFADQLLREAYGLQRLRHAALDTGIDVPQVIHVDQRTLSIPFIQTGQGLPAHWRKLGQGLAQLHSKPQLRFGFEEDNYIGLNQQLNCLSDSWGDFFVRWRLQFQVGLIADGRRQQYFSRRLQQRAARIREFLDTIGISPSFLHGDLWSGNVLCGEDGRVWLIDPAAYYGDADADLAMTQMFGGFPSEFYSAYRALRPESSSWALKKQVYNTYHYLNHLNLFGDAYLAGCEAGFDLFDRI